MDPALLDRALAAAKAGEAWGCARLYEELKRPVTAYVRMRGAADPDDVTSETFLGVFRDLHAFEGDADQFRAWVFTIAHRRVLDDHRRRSRRPVLTCAPRDLDPAGGDVEAEALAALGAERAAELLAVLTPDQREVVLLRIVADLSLEHVAEVTGRTVNAVKALQHRALNALRRAMTEQPVTRRDPAAIPGAR